MQPGGAHKGVSDKSLLFHSLKVYLNNKNRLQPIIGLGSVTECVKAGTHGREILYLCEVCVCRLIKTDIRNHIMGSLHRYNYINAWHPHFVAEWKKNADLSKLAWPLMEMAKILEGREGPGDVQVLILEEAVYQEIASHSETDAVTMLNAIRHGQRQSETQSQSDATSAQLEHCTVQSRRVVLPPKKHLGPSIQSTAAPSVKLKGRQNTSVVSHLGNDWKSLEASVQSGSSFLDGYTGIKPLIGLDCVVECRSEEDGHAYCFLCHCCRIKSIKDDIIDHLTSSSHHFNYMMEVHPEQVEVMMAGINGNSQLLQSVAKKVEQEKGRGELKVMKVPASLCILLTGNSYHWCIKMLSNGNGWRSTNIQKRKIAVKGPSVTEASDQGMPHKRTAALLKCTDMAKKKRIGNVTDPVFKVSLPLTAGSLLLKRTSFSLDHVPVSPTADPALSPSPGPRTVVSELASSPESEHMTSKHTISRPQFDDLSSGDSDKHTDGQYLGQERNFRDTLYYEVDGNVSYSKCFDKSQKITVINSYERRIIRNLQATFETENRPTYDSFLHEKQDCGLSDCFVSEKENAEERSDSRQHHTQGGHTQHWQNEGLDREDERLPADVYHAQDWSTYNSYHRGEEGCTEEEYSSNFQGEVGLRVEVPRDEGQREIRSDTTYKQDYKHQHQQQYLAQNYTSLPTDSARHHGSHSEMASPSGVHGSDVNPHLNDSIAHSGGIAAEPRMQILQVEQRGLWTSGYMQPSPSYVQPAPHGHMTQPVVYPSFQVGHGVTSDPYYNDGPRNKPDLYLPQTNANTGGLRSQPNMFILPGQAQVYGTHSDHFSSGVGNDVSGVMMPGREPSYKVIYPCPSPGPGVPIVSSHIEIIQHFF